MKVEIQGSKIRSLEKKKVIQTDGLTQNIWEISSLIYLNLLIERKTHK